MVRAPELQKGLFDMRTKLALFLAVGGLSVSACAQGVPLGAATPVNADSYYAGAPYFDQSACWANGWAGTFDYPYCGWYNGFFYPGSGSYMYDHNRQPRALSPDQRSHWAGQSPALTNGMHSPGPIRTPGAFGGSHFGPGAGGPGIAGGHGFGRGFGGHSGGHLGGHSGRH
jgi:hypothetical protein